MFVKPAMTRCNTQWPTGVVTKVNSAYNVDVDNMLRSIRDIRKVVGGGEIVPIVGHQFNDDVAENVAEDCDARSIGESTASDSEVENIAGDADVGDDERDGDIYEEEGIAIQEPLDGGLRAELRRSCRDRKRPARFEDYDLTT